MKPDHDDKPSSQNSNHHDNQLNIKPNQDLETTIQDKAINLFKNAEILAPMVRASSTPLRTLALSYGADLVFTEEIVDRSITTTDRVYNKELNTIDYTRKLDTFSPRVLKRMAENKENAPIVLRIAPSVEKGKLIYQMGTGESNLALPAALMVQNDVDGIDINMGCPKKFSVSGGMGSALLQDLPRACDIISTLKRNISIPLSCKIRLLNNTKATVDFVTSLVHAGANAITIHAREVGDEAIHPAKSDRLIDVVKILKSTASLNGVPIILNGDLYTRNDMINMKRRCNADGVMLARPALYNTSIFRKPESSQSQQSSTGTCGIEDDVSEERIESRYGYESPLLLSKTQVIQDYISHANIFQTNYKNVKYVVCEMMNNRRTPSTLCHLMPQSYPGNQTIDIVCRCRSIEDFCQVWNVSKSTVPTILSSLKTSHTHHNDDDNTISNNNQRSEVDLHRYDDRYFLDPENFKREREEELTQRSHDECSDNVTLEKRVKIDDSE